jgi:hypothetical protein
MQPFNFFAGKKLFLAKFVYFKPVNNYRYCAFPAVFSKMVPGTVAKLLRGECQHRNRYFSSTEFCPVNYGQTFAFFHRAKISVFTLALSSW